jgi:alkanesulfonate monooxygenase SsuD/methylene tetrahydromethanopterin reductase-like flavin-dependent oxidoreductase (luciferase family)
MRFAYFTAQEVGDRNPGAVVREAVAEAVAAERAGFDGVFVSEHHGMKFGYLPIAVPLMYLIASATNRVDVGAGVLLLPLMQPTRLAEELAVLDHLSGGRVILGLGAGYVKEDFDAFGVNPAHAAGCLEEGIKILRSLWSGRQVDHDGVHYRVTGFTLFPEPIRPDGIPIWIGGRSRPGVRRAAGIGDAWILDATPRLEMFVPWYRLYRDEVRQAGKTPKLAVLRDGWVHTGKTADGAYRQAALASHRHKLGAGVYAIDPEFAGRLPQDVTFDELARDRWLTGTGAEIRSQLARWQEIIGVEYVLIRMRNRGLPAHDQVLEQIAAFGEEVIAPFRANAVSGAGANARGERRGD